MAPTGPAQSSGKLAQPTWQASKCGSLPRSRRFATARVGRRIVARRRARGIYAIPSTAGRRHVRCTRQRPMKLVTRFAPVFVFGLAVACGGSNKPAEEPDGSAENAGEKVDEAAEDAE